MGLLLWLTSSSFANCYIMSSVDSSWDPIQSYLPKSIVNPDWIKEIALFDALPNDSIIKTYNSNNTIRTIEVSTWKCENAIVNATSWSIDANLKGIYRLNIYQDKIHEYFTENNITKTYQKKLQLRTWKLAWFLKYHDYNFWDWINLEDITSYDFTNLSLERQQTLGLLWAIIQYAEFYKIQQ